MAESSGPTAIETEFVTNGGLQAETWREAHVAQKTSGGSLSGKAGAVFGLIIVGIEKDAEIEAFLASSGVENRVLP